MIKPLHAIAAAALAAGIAAPASALVTINVVNASFEAFGAVSQIGCGTGCSYTTDPILGWTNSGGGNGQFSPGSSSGNFTYFNYVPDGVTVAYTNAGPISQTVAETAIAGRTYTLTTQFGVRNDIGNPGSISLTVGGTTVVATGTEPAPGNWAAYTATYTATAADAGQAITITLDTVGSQGDFDAVSLVRDVPEPATWAMMIAGFGLVGFAARRRRRALAA